LSRRKAQRLQRPGPRSAARRTEPEIKSNESQTQSAHRIDSLRFLQQAHGNAFVKRLLHVRTSSLQREEAAPQASATVPGLSQEVVRQIESGLRDKRQGALDTLSAALVKRGDIDLSFLAGGSMTYVGDNSGMAPNHYGHTSLTEGTGLPRPSKVQIGPDAFQSVSELYTTVLHEWKHVLQFRKPEAISDAMAEFEAYLGEIANLDLTGQWRDVDYMNRLSNLLHGYWSRLTDVEKAALRDSYDAAKDTIVAKRLQALQEVRERIKSRKK
jgi:hypothetical protein